jgi:GT2 family glycosyltransferase
MPPGTSCSPSMSPRRVVLMSPPRSVSIQSILYATGFDAFRKAVEAAGNAASHAVDLGAVSEWSYATGDCSPSPALNPAQVKELVALCALRGGVFTYEFFDANLGHGGGHNRLARGSASELILFLNPDGVLAPNALSELARSLTEGVGLTDARQIPLEHPKWFDARTGDQSWASGACLLAVRQVFDDAGGFDHDNFFMYGDDVDLSWRVRLTGQRVVHSSAARVFHDKRLGPSGGYVATEAELYYSVEGAILLAHKYSRPRRVRTVLAWCRREATPPLIKAVAEYESRRAAGSLPQPIDRNHRVAEFVGQNFGRTRF